VAAGLADAQGSLTHAFPGHTCVQATVRNKLSIRMGVVLSLHEHEKGLRKGGVPPRTPPAPTDMPPAVIVTPPQPVDTPPAPTHTPPAPIIAPTAPVPLPAPANQPPALVHPPPTHTFTRPNKVRRIQPSRAAGGFGVLRPALYQQMPRRAPTREFFSL
jgi:hypothetical protein